MKKIISLIGIIILSLSLIACSDLDLGFEDENSLNPGESVNNESKDSEEDRIDEDGRYSSKEDVALYIHTYGKLPKNFITKREASELGWESNKGNLWDVTDDMSIGGDKFGNREKRLPIEEGRTYYECDIDYEGGYRGSERLVYSNDGLVYYTEDHYESFTLLYGDE